MIRTAIVDDEPLAVEILKDYVEKNEALELAFAGTDVFECLKLVQKNEIDVVFLDVQMPELTGIQFMKIIGNQCQIILTTAYTDYALDSYEYDVVDYLLKPISYERFHKAVQKIVLKKSETPTQQKDFLFVKSEYKTLKINYKDIIYIKSSTDYVEYYFKVNPKILSLDSLKNLENKLSSALFIRIHKSYIINLKNIDYIERNRVIMTNGERLPIGESYRNRFFKQME